MKNKSPSADSVQLVPRRKIFKHKREACAMKVKEQIRPVRDAMFVGKIDMEKPPRMGRNIIN
jgi:hypothetical protein